MYHPASIYFSIVMIVTLGLARGDGGGINTEVGYKPVDGGAIRRLRLLLPNLTLSWPVIENQVTKSHVCLIVAIKLYQHYMLSRWSGVDCITNFLY